jgi:hypothetical protein
VESPPFTRASLAALLASPKTYDSRPVQTSGYARETARGLFLFLTQGDARHRLYMNAISLEVDESAQEGRDLVGRIDDQFVTVTGTFDWLGEGALALREVSSGSVHLDADAGGAAQ